MTERKKRTSPVRVLPAGRRRSALFQKLTGDSSSSRAVKHRSDRIQIDSGVEEATTLAAESSAFGGDEGRDEKASKKKKKSGFLGEIKNFKNKFKEFKRRSYSDDSVIDDPEYGHAVAAAEEALVALRDLRFSIGEAGTPWDGTEYQRRLLNLHEMECGDEPGAAPAAAEKADSFEYLDQHVSSMTVSCALRNELNTVQCRKDTFDSEVDEMRALLHAMQTEPTISSLAFHSLFSLVHHLTPVVRPDEAWAALIVDAARLLHDFSEVRRVVMLLLLMTTAQEEEKESEAELMRTLLLRVTIGAVTEWTKLASWQQDVVVCLLMRADTTDEEKRRGGGEKRRESAGGRHTLNRSKERRRDELRPGAEEALRDAGILDPRLTTRADLKTAAKDLGRRLEQESTRLINGHRVCFPSIAE